MLKDAFSTRTVMMWFKLNTLEGRQVLYDEGNATVGLVIRWDQPNDLFQAGVAPGASIGWERNVVVIDEWTHVALTFDHGLMGAYLNGLPSGRIEVQVQRLSSV